jgi:autoinducer-2 kinase
VSITTPTRLRWLARHRPDILKAARGLGMLSDWITFRLAGVQVTEPSCGHRAGPPRLLGRNGHHVEPDER